MITYKPIALYFSFRWKKLTLLRKITLNLLPIKLFIQKWDLPKEIQTKYLFTQSMDRRDYNEFVNTVFNSLDTSNKKYLMVTTKVKLNFDILSVKLKEVKNIWRDVDSHNLFEKLFIFLSILQVVTLGEYLKNYRIHLHTTHADMLPVENYVVQYFRAQNIKTVTFQHGLYIDYTKYPNINEVNYRNIVSEYFLAWGNETKNLIQKYHPNCKVFVCGNPMVKNENYKSKDFFTVVFDQEAFKEFNQNMIFIAQEFAKRINLKILFKLHPRNKIDDYNFDKNLLVENENINNSLFAIGHTSTLMFELMIKGIPTFKYNTKIPSNHFNNNLTFCDVDELFQKLNNKKEIDFFEEARYYIKSTNKEALEEYKSTLIALAE
jgi:hypothetical protein